jgi:hypothetical protein
MATKPPEQKRFSLLPLLETLPQGSIAAPALQLGLRFRKQLHRLPDPAFVRGFELLVLLNALAARLLTFARAYRRSRQVAPKDGRADDAIRHFMAGWADTLDAFASALQQIIDLAPELGLDTKPFVAARQHAAQERDVLQGWIDAGDTQQLIVNGTTVSIAYEVEYGKLKQVLLHRLEQMAADYRAKSETATASKQSPDPSAPLRRVQLDANTLTAAINGGNPIKLTATQFKVVDVLASLPHGQRLVLSKLQRRTCEDARKVLVRLCEPEGSPWRGVIHFPGGQRGRGYGIW